MASYTWIFYALFLLVCIFVTSPGATWPVRLFLVMFIQVAFWLVVCQLYAIAAL